MIWTHIAIGFGLAFLGLVAPAMLNMTTVRASIESGSKSGVLFGMGAATVNAIHALIAFTFIRHLDSNPQIIAWLQRIGVLVLFALAYFFYDKSKQIPKSKSIDNGVPTFIRGAGMSLLNMLALPYYLGSSLILEADGHIITLAPYSYYLAGGVLLGSMTIFIIYALGAERISLRSAYITKNINLILAGIFVLLGLLVLVQLFV